MDAGGVMCVCVCACVRACMGLAVAQGAEEGAVACRRGKLSKKPFCETWAYSDT